MAKKTFLSIVFLAVAFSVTPFFARAADLYFYPSTGSYQTGDSFSVRLMVSSPDQAMNAASGVISFDPALLEITSLSKTGSLFNVWVQDPSFSNSAGTLDFEGVVLNPGFTGTAGKILTINFKAKKEGKPVVNFSLASVLANDGKGTNILKTLGSVQFSVVAASKTQAAAPVAAGVVPGAPNISSPSHPDPVKWYSTSDVSFSWDIPENVTDVSFLLDTQPMTTTEKLRGLVNAYTYKDIGDGVWYLHIKFKNSQGWGPFIHRAVRIDTQKPKAMVLAFPHGAISLDNRPVALFNTTDSLSGIDHYEVKIGDQYTYQLLPDAIASSNPYVIPPQAPGKYSMKVLAYDKAGNTVEAEGSFEIIALDLPEVTSMPETIYEGDFFRITGKTYPNATVVAVLKKDGREVQEESVFSSALGRFTLPWPTYLKKGDYSISFSVTNEEGAQSLSTPERSLIVEGKYIVNLGIFKLTLAMISWFLFFLFLLMNVFTCFWIYFFSPSKKHLNKGFVNVEKQLNELVLHMSTKKTRTGVKSSIAKVKKIVDDIHKL